MNLSKTEKAVSLTFSCNESRELLLEINPVDTYDGENATIDEEHISTLWARLGMKYFNIMKNKGMFVDSVPHVHDVKFVILFSNSENIIENTFVDFDNLNPSVYFDDENIDEFYDDEFSADFKTLQSDDLAWSIGFKIFSERLDLIGGLATPTAVAAMSVFKLLNDARSQVKA